MLWIALLLGCSPGRLPVSTSTAPVPDAEAVLVVDGSEVVLDGEHLGAVADLGEMTLLREALDARGEAIRTTAARDPAAPAFRGALALEVDRDHEAGLLLRLVDGATQAGFRRPWLVVQDDGGARHGISLAVPAVALAAVAGAGEAADGSWANPKVSVLPEKGFVLHVRDRVFDQLTVPCAASPCEDWPVVELNRLARRLKLDHPRDRAVVVVADPAASVQAVVHALDATRHDGFAGRGNQELFPDALLARGVR